MNVGTPVFMGLGGPIVIFSTKPAAHSNAGLLGKNAARRRRLTDACRNLPIGRASRPED